MSRDARRASTTALDSALEYDGANGAALGDELFAVVGLLSRELPLRRMLADASHPVDERVAVANSLFGNRLSESTCRVVAVAVAQRWSRSRDLLNALDDMAVRAVVADAESAGVLDAAEDELFRFRRIVSGDTALRLALADPAAPVEARVGLVDSLLDGKVTSATKRLVDEAIRHPRRGSLDDALERYGRLAAEQRARFIARVTSAVALTDEQQARLVAALRRIYDHDVVLDVEVDPTVLGGLAVQVGDEVIDGTVLARLDEARRRIAG